jgi:CO/xanthine dehydrogenase FAD-binding subunit
MSDQALADVASSGRCDWFRPEQLSEALSALARGGWKILAGGTDLYPARTHANASRLLDITGVDALRGVSEDRLADGTPAWRIGATTTWSMLARGEVAPELQALAQAAREVGGIQIQNQATIGGNLCNASPAADGVPVLLALDASVELVSLRGTRMLPLAQFLTGARQTVLACDELLAAVWLPRGSARARSAFAKLGHRRYLVISITMAAVALDLDEKEQVSRLAVAVGSASAVAARLTRLEQALVSTPLAQLGGRAREALADPRMLQALSPIDDVRGTAAYRMHAARELVARLLEQIGGAA